MTKALSFLFLRLDRLADCFVLCITVTVVAGNVAGPPAGRLSPDANAAAAQVAAHAKKQVLLRQASSAAHAQLAPPAPLAAPLVAQLAARSSAPAP